MKVEAKSVIPQDIIDAALKIGVDMEDLVKLCVDHTVEAARAWLSLFQGKFGKS